MNTAIWWIRRDLRLIDNPALSAAVAQGGAVIPCFILDPRLMDHPNTAPKRRAFLLAGLAALDADLRRRGGRLVIRQGDPYIELQRLQQESGATAIFAEADFSPYFRIFNPVTQGKKFDPEGRFVRRWLPELAHVPAKYIHEPWKMTPEEQNRYGYRLGRGYPAPIVDRKLARQRTLDAYAQARAQGDA